jgi:hypothetical protein
MGRSMKVKYIWFALGRVEQDHIQWSEYDHLIETCCNYTRSNYM